MQWELISFIIKVIVIGILKGQVIVVIINYLKAVVSTTLINSISSYCTSAHVVMSRGSAYTPNKGSCVRDSLTALNSGSWSSCTVRHLGCVLDTSLLVYAMSLEECLC